MPTMPTEQQTKMLEAFISSAWKTAVMQMFVEQKLRLMVAVHNSSTKQFVPMLADSIAQIEETVRDTMKELDSDIVILLGEAWVSRANENTAEELERLRREKVANQPDRIEVVIVQYATKWGQSGTQIRKIEEKEGQRLIGPQITSLYPIPMQDFMERLFPTTLH